MLLGNFGAELKAFRMFDHAATAAVLRSVYAIDALLSIPRARAELGATWTDYVEPAEGQRPVLELVHNLCQLSTPAHRRARLCSAVLCHARVHFGIGSSSRPVS